MKHNFNKVFTLEPLKSQFLIDGELVWKTEEFKEITEWEYYQVSTFGRVMSNKRMIWNKGNNCFRVQNERILKPCAGSNGYYVVVLCGERGKNTFRVSTLVAMAFLDHKPNGMKIVIDHKDNIKSNNYLSNLQLITIRKNSSKDKFRGNYSSKYIGVYWHKQHNKWTAEIHINGKTIHLGYFENETDAANAYKVALSGVV